MRPWTPHITRGKTAYGRTDGRMDGWTSFHVAHSSAESKRGNPSIQRRAVCACACVRVCGGGLPKCLSIYSAHPETTSRLTGRHLLSLSVDRSIDPLFDDSSLSRLVVKNTEFSGRGYLYLFFSLRFCFREKWVSVGFFFWRFRLMIVLLY